jgi:hypothetical protein
MTLSETIKSIAVAKAAASRDPDVEPLFTRGAVEGAINAAKNDIARLTAEVRNLTNQVSGGIFVTGPGTDAFAAIAEDEGGAVTVDAGALYERLTDVVERVLESNASREWRIDIVRALVANLAGLANRLGIAYMKPIDTTKYTRCSLPTRADTLAMVRDVVRTALLDELNGLLLQQDIADAVIKAEYEQNVVPVIVRNAHPDDVVGLGAFTFNKRFVTVTTKEVVEKSDVITAFKHLKPLLKRTTN